MALEMLGVETLPEELASFLLRKSEGNPLYCHEIMSFLMRQRLLLPATIVDGKPVAISDPSATTHTLGDSMVDQNFRADSKRITSNTGSATTTQGLAVQTVLLSPGLSLSSLESAFAAEGSVAGNSHTLQRLLTAQVIRSPKPRDAHCLAPAEVCMAAAARLLVQCRRAHPVA